MRTWQLEFIMQGRTVNDLSEVIMTSERQLFLDRVAIRSLEIDYNHEGTIIINNRDGKTEFWELSEAIGVAIKPGR